MSIASSKGVRVSAHRIVIIGAGYAGVMAANRLAGSRRIAGAASVTVVNPSGDFVERIRLHEVAAGSRESASVPLRSLLHPHAAVVVGTAARIDPAARTVHFTDGREPLEYDSLLYAVGSCSAAADPDGFDLHDAQGAGRLRSRLEQLEAGAAVSVIGGGLTGIEAAAEIAEQHPRLHVRLVSRGGIGEDLSAAGRREVSRRLRRLGVDLLEDTEAASSGEGQVTTSAGTRLPSDCTVWTAGFTAPGLAGASGLPTDADGRLLVDESLSCREYPEIFGAGDAVRPPAAAAGHLRMSCAAAMPMGAHAADAIIARLQQRAPKKFSAGFMVRCISLGRASGLLQAVHADDRPRQMAVRGRLAGFGKEQICRMTLAWIRGEARRSGSYTWPRGPKPAEAR
jgi:NADH:ubiquinone reductase (H+-translocating)